VAHGLMEEQIIQNVHRGTPDDNPIMAPDHYVQDYPIKDLVYLKNMRRGSDMLTVTTAMLLRVAPQRVYPVTFGCLTLVLAAGVCFGRHGFDMKLSRAWPVPSSFWPVRTMDPSCPGQFQRPFFVVLFLLAPCS